MITEFLVQFSYIILFIISGLLLSSLISNYQQVKLKAKCLKLDIQIENLTDDYKLSLLANKKISIILDMLPMDKILKSMPEKEKEDLSLELEEIINILDRITAKK